MQTEKSDIASLPARKSPTIACSEPSPRNSGSKEPIPVGTRCAPPRASPSPVDAGTRGRGDAGTRGRGDAGTRGRGDAGTRGRGDAGTRGRGDAGTRGRGDAGTRGRDKRIKRGDRSWVYCLPVSPSPR